MKGKLLLLLLFFCFNSFAQSDSDIKIIYEYKDQIILNNGKTYKVLSDKPFYAVYDNSIQVYQEIDEHILRLNRVLILDSDNTKVKLIEWVKKEMRMYKLSEVQDTDLKDTNISSGY
ncbi:hypothetical protein [Aquimarina pacifica]|uniref:hypothetical protein n=1 Tax=Aquimarina pacifica TaxID=1296415 RepID=UPI000472E3AB|nr:hypothetical protein [Aquimarina pacifica]